MNERIKEVRKSLGLTQQEFADRIGVKRNTVATYEGGRNIPIDSVVSLICKEFNVNEEWLRTGEGEMFQDLSQGELAAKVVGEALANDNEFIQSVFISLGKLTPTEWKVVEKFITSVEEEMKKK
ncbi:MAG: helix-turn-helix transcriptional regulator [Lachnospiraceae bacterium]|nr:helix-turn-helix transcriptional regulator [Lachnospiraceae bacterium]